MAFFIQIMEIPILYEDSDCLFINKPAGLSVHADGKSPVYTLADWVLEKYPTLFSVGEPLLVQHKGEEITIPKPGIVHRLDKDTSGVMVIAKNQKTYEFFKKQFQDHKIQKVYHCFVYGWPKENSLDITDSIGRDSGDIRKWTTGKGSRGITRLAFTHIEILKRFGNAEYEGKGNTKDGVFSFVEARPKTGRTHQIRVHLRSINHPIVSDSLYAQKREKALGFERQALHARELGITLPGEKKTTIVAPYPSDFDNALKSCGF